MCPQILVTEVRVHPVRRTCLTLRPTCGCYACVHMLLLIWRQIHRHYCDPVTFCGSCAELDAMAIIRGHCHRTSGN